MALTAAFRWAGVLGLNLLLCSGVDALWGQGEGGRASGRGEAGSATLISPLCVGVNMHPERSSRISAENQFELCRRLGVGQVRLSLEWAALEPGRGTYDFAVMDRMVDLAEKKGLRILQVLGYNALWNAPPGGNTKTKPVDLEAFETFVSQMAERYRGRIKWWEVWNEPNSDTFLTGPYSVNPERRWHDYHLILERARRALKRADPLNVIVLGGLAHTSESWGQDLEACYTTGIISQCDVLAIHPYVGIDAADPGNFNRAVEQMLEVMKRHNDADRPVWITEVGLPTAGHALAVSEEAQAGFLARILTTALNQTQIKKVFFYSLLDDAESFGLFRADGSAKPSACRVQGMLKNGQ